jgi:hypothetical protein
LARGARALPAAIHGTAAFLSLFIGTIGPSLGWHLMTATIRAFADLRLRW